MRHQWPLPTTQCRLPDAILRVLQQPTDHGLIDLADWLSIVVLGNDLDLIVHGLSVAVQTVLPPDARYGTGAPSKAKVFTLMIFAVGAVRLRRALLATKCPAWARTVVAALPTLLRDRLIQHTYAWWREVQQYVLQPDSGAAVYCLFSHTGVYFGKANISRAGRYQPNAGLAERAVEHLRGLLLPHSRDGRLHRYRALRNSIGSFSMIPVCVSTSEVQALAIESCLIKALAPNCNGADLEQWRVEHHAHINIRPSRARPRRRPFPRFRQRLLQSVWASDVFAATVLKKVSPQPVGTIDDQKGSYSRLYREVQLAYSAMAGFVGPLYIFANNHRNLMASYCASARPCLDFPAHWGRPRAAEIVYSIGRTLKERLQGAAARQAARRFLEGVLRRLKLPPLTVRPLSIPRVFKQKRGLIRKIIFECLQSVRVHAARVWLQDNIRIMFSKAARWRDRFNVKRCLSNFTSRDLARKSDEELGELAQIPSLQAHLGPWGLAQWPEQATVARQIRSAWRSWAHTHRLHPRVLRAADRHLQGRLLRAQVPCCPDRWREQEVEFRRVLREHECVLPDDRDPCKAWTVRTEELVAHLFHAFAADEMWNFKHNLDTSIVLPWHFGRAQACFPDWLLGRPRAAYRSLSPPVLFAFVKSKCFHDDGIKKCQKPNHSCLRRILDMAEIPYSRAWKLAARAVRGVVQATGCTREVFSMEAAVPMLTSGVQRLAPPWRYGEKCPETTPVSSCIGQCRCCGKAINGLAVFSADIDQAFEACRAERVTPAWSRLTRRYQDKTGCSAIYVQKGTKFVYRIPTEAAWSRSWWVFTLALLAGILQAATLFNIITFSDKVVELLGLSIGGVMSAAAVSVCLGDEEARVVLQESQVPGFPHFESSDELLRSIFWLRYVDDLLAISRQFCSSCLERFFHNVYCEPLSVVFSSDGVARPAMFEWLDLEIHLYTTSLSWTQKILIDPGFWTGGHSLKSSTILWMGISPISFFKVQLMGRIARGGSQHPSHALL